METRLWGSSCRGMGERYGVRCRLALETSRNRKRTLRISLHPAKFSLAIPTLKRVGFFVSRFGMGWGISQLGKLRFIAVAVASRLGNWIAADLPGNWGESNITSRFEVGC